MKDLSKAKQALLQEISSLKEKIRELEQAKDASGLTEALRTEEEHQRLFETMTQGVIYYSATGEMVSANPAAQRILGLSLEQMLGKTFERANWKLIREDGSELPAEEHPIRTVLRTGKPVERFVLGILNPVKDTLTWLSTSQIPLFNQGETSPFQVYAMFDDITDRKLAQAEAEHLASFPELNLNPILEVNLSGEIIFCNPATKRVLKDLGGNERDPHVFLPPDCQAILRDWNRINDFTLVREISVRDRIFGETIHLVARFGVMRIYVSDITEYKRSEEALRISQLRLSEAMDLAHIVYWEHDPIAGLFILNDPFYALYRTTAEMEGGYELTTEEFAKRFIHPDDLPLLNGIMGQTGAATDQESLTDFEHRIIRRDGEIRHVLVRRRVVTDDSGRIVRRYGVNQDITERKRAEQKIIESERSLQAILAASPIGIGQVKDRVIQWVNEAMCQLSGYTLKELKGKSTRILHESDESFRLVGESLYTIGEAEHRLVRKDGTLRDIFVHISTTGSYSFTFTVTDITRLKQIERDLKKSELLYRTLVETSSEIIMLRDANRKRVYVSPNVTKVLGYTVDEFLAESRAGFVHPDSAAAVDATRPWALAHPGEPVHFVARGRHKDGSWRWFEFTVRNLLQDPNVASMVFNLHDITELKEAEEALRASQLHLTEAMDLAHIVYWEFDPEAQTYIFNDPFYALYGTTAEREGGYRMTREEYAKRFIYPDDLPLFYQFVKQNTSRSELNSVGQIEHRVIRRDGEVRHIVGRASVIKDDSGRIVKRYGANQDITDRKKMEEALQEGEEKFRRMFEESPLGMVMVDSGFHFIRTNAAFCRMLGYTEQELAALTFKDITHPEHLDSDVRNVGDLTSGKIPLYRTEKRYIRKNKTILWGSITVNIIRDRDGQFSHFLTTIEDISQRKQAEEEKRRLESQLHQASKLEAIGTLAGGVAHDFNNILTSLLGYAALLKMKLNNPTLQAYVDQILSASHKATDLIQSLLAFSRQQAIRLEPVSLHRMIRGTEKLLKRLLTEDIRVRTMLSEEDITIMADATQIDQILFNLATNARDAMPQGGALTIETKSVELDNDFRRFYGFGEPGRYALLAVSDTGVGMDEATKEHIFDPFFTTKEVGKGTGLGLSTVYGIVKQHNGYINVYSEPNKGTTFHIYLPAVAKAGEDDASAPAPIKGGNETILIAEDNEPLRTLIGKILMEYGYKTIEAVDGADAVEQFKNAVSVDLLLLDSVMPRKNGWEAYQEIRKIKPDIKVVFTSGHTRDVFLDKGIEDGKLNFLKKPILPQTLLQKIREVLDHEDSN
ncbi:MAG TPA: PAS domain S-box protein [Syntrophorhabdaceae bacterium]|nr:PAS domain S-box protein [Syntrophorhabdaceae bacterium]